MCSYNTPYFMKNGKICMSIVVLNLSHWENFAVLKAYGKIQAATCVDPENKLGSPHILNATYLKVPRSSAFWFWRRF